MLNVNIRGRRRRGGGGGEKEINMEGGGVDG